jgi:hypothetical protein
VLCTLKKPDQVIEQGEKIIKQLKNNQLISSKQLRAYINEFSANANLLIIVEYQLKMNQRASIRKRARQKLADTIAQKRGIIIVNDVRHNHLMRSQKKIEKMQTRDRRLKAARQKKILLHDKAIAKRFRLVGKKTISWAEERSQLILNSFILKEVINDRNEKCAFEMIAPLRWAARLRRWVRKRGRSSTLIIEL